MQDIDVVRNALRDECGVDPAAISAGVHVIDDLGLDSLDLLNAVFRIEKEVGVKLPFKAWLEEEYGPSRPRRSPFLVDEICQYIATHRR